MPKNATDKRKKILAALLAIVAVLVLLLGGWFAWKQTSPPLPENIADIEGLLNDSRYLAMDNAQQRPYQERMSELWGGMSPEDRERLGELLEGNPDAQQAAVDAAAQAERDKYADAVRSGDMSDINERMDSLGEGMASMGPFIQNMSEEQRTQMRDGMNRFLDTGDPQAMGFMSEMFKGMMQRRRDRGLGGF